MGLKLKLLQDLMRSLNLVGLFPEISDPDVMWNYSALIVYILVLRLLGLISFCFLCLKDTFIQKTKKLYQDTRTQRNIAKLNDELYEVHQIMTRNVQEVLGVGEKLDRKFLFAST